MSQSNRFYPNPTYFRARRQPGEMAAYLLGMGPMPPPTQQEIAVAAANRMLDNATPGPANIHDDLREENIDPQLRTQQVTQVDPPAGPLIGRVLTRIPINDGKATRDIEINIDIPLQDFVSRMCANMGLDPTTAEIGWKSGDDAKRAPARQLATEDDLKTAFRDLLKLKNNTRRTKEVVMHIIHTNPHPVEAPKKKTDGNRTTDFAYYEELRIVQEKLRCAKHPGPNRWCYVSPENPNEHIKLALEEVTLWARKLKDDPDVDRECVVPPNCLSLDRLRERKHRTGGKKTGPATQPIHVNITNNPLASASSANQYSYPRSSLKRAISYSTDDDTDSESLTISDILTELHVKYPKLNFPQYKVVLANNGIVYTESVIDFDKDFYLDLGIAEGAIGPFMKGISRALHRERKEKKRAKLGDKENQGYCRQESVEI
ncbi:hypothetical protein BYT27DRAFT_7277025 [Phlegmacium glaucopus]|nr:hypothetical protein BYT27DRAFT_7277025 [Phlegmacium glaucopus]